MGVDQLVTGGDFDDPVVDSLTSDSVNTERERITRQSPILIGNSGWRSDFDGSDEETRLQNAISAASRGDKIMLESGEYTADLDITGNSSNQITFVGTGGREGGGTEIDADWTLADRSGVKNVKISGSLSLGLLSFCGFSTIYTGNSPTLVARDDQVRFVGLAGGGETVKFQSGTSNGIVDASTGVTVTDNGSNTVGDIA